MASRRKKPTAAVPVLPQVPAGAWRRDRALWAAVALMLGMSYLLFKGLDDTYFWDDEAEVAIFARNLVTEGELTGWDGRNLFAFRNGTTTDASLQTRQPPLMFYAAALGFRVLGASTWAGRAPFVFAAILSLIVFWRLLRRLFPSEPAIALYGLTSMGLSVTFILSARQCRYYSLCLLFTLVTYDQYRRCFETGKLRHYAGLALAAAALFFSHYLIGAIFLATLACMHGLAHRERWPVVGTFKLVGSGLLFLALCLPYAVSHRIWDRGDLPAPTAPWYIGRPLLVMQYLRDLNEINVLPVLGLVGVVVMAVHQREWRRYGLIFLGMALLNCVITGWVTPQPYHSFEPADVRYLIASLPFAAAALGMWLAWMHKRSKWLGLAAATVLLGSNGLSAQHKLGYKLLLPRYVREVHASYPTAQEVASEAILEYASVNDLVMTVPDFESLPMLFYAGEKVKVCCLLNGNSPLARGTVQALGAQAALLENNFPHWIVGYGPDAMLRPMLGFMQRPHNESGEFKQYRYTRVKALGTYYKGTQRSELPFHTFGPKIDYNHDTEDVYLFRRDG